MIYTSPQQRALNTAKLIRRNKNTEIKVHNGLKELRYGSWEGMYISDIEKDYPEDYHSYINDPEQYMPEDGESMVDLFKRLNLFLGEISTMNYQNYINSIPWYNYKSYNCHNQRIVMAGICIS